MKISPARTAAFDVLLRIEKEKGFSSNLLPAAEEKLSPQDRGLCHQLVLGSLRNQIYLDRLIQVLSQGRRLDHEVMIALRLAIYQLKFLDRIPAHSAVNESVNLVQRAKKSSAKPFVNAILRRFLREDVQLDLTNELDRISVQTSHPRWLIEKWAADRGLEEARSIAISNNSAPAVAFRLLDSGEEMEQEIHPYARRSEFVPGCFIADSNNHLMAVLGQQSRIYFQDEASQMVAYSVGVHPSDRILDLCASPGGKTGILVEKARQSNATVIACDSTTDRVRLLAENCRRQRAAPDGIVQLNATVWLPFDTGSFHSVLVDAPCSGTGTIRHNPEVRYRVQPSDFEGLSTKQLSILISASEMVRPGGYLIYSTCSLEHEENEDVCGRFLKDVRGFKLAAPLLPRRFRTSDGYASTRPDRDEMDGFFIARFQRS